MVVRVEDLLEEARKEGGGDVAEAEVHMGYEVPWGWEEKVGEENQYIHFP